MTLSAPGDAVVWRYLDLAKYLHLITTSSLYFANVTEFNDPHEATLPELAAQDLKNRLEAEERFQKEVRKEIEQILPNLRGKMLPGTFITNANTALDMLEAVRRDYCISCWYMLKRESDAMWRLYASLGSGLAIRSTVAALRSSVQCSELSIHPVTYLDFEAELPLVEPGTPDYFLLLLKRTAFLHESELRLIAKRVPENPEYRGFNIKCDLDSMINEVVISPYAPQWLHEVLANITKSLHPSLTIRFSHLGKAPIVLHPIKW